MSLAKQTDTLEALEEEVSTTVPEFQKRIDRLPLNVAKAPRWSGEMIEISQAMAAVGLKGGAKILEGAAETWDLVATTSIGQEPIELARERGRDWKEVAAIVSAAAAQKQ